MISPPCERDQCPSTQTRHYPVKLLQKGSYMKWRHHDNSQTKWNVVEERKHSPIAGSFLLKIIVYYARRAHLEAINSRALLRSF